MFNGTLKNTFVGNTPLARLSIGITGTDGKRASLEFVRDDASGDLVAQLDEDEATERNEMTETEITCARCQQPIAPDADYEYSIFPPICPSDSGERIYRYHPQCYTDDGAEHAEHRAIAFDPNYIPGGE